MKKIILWGLTASPYQLKMQALLDFAGIAWERWPEQAGRLPALAMELRLRAARRRGAVRRFPRMEEGLDEYPAVPYYTLDGRTFFYDSSSLAAHLDAHPDRGSERLLPEAPALAFLCHLVDEAYDEFGLYMVHHQRWVGSARSNRMGEFTAREMGLPRPLVPALAGQLSRRQVRRCPYLFSVAPRDYDCGVSAARTPPARPGFPPTHELLDSAWHAYLDAMEQLLQRQPYLLGERFTLADASAYGQLGMNMVDPEAADQLRERAPRTWRWLCAVRDAEHVGGTGALAISGALRPLLDIIAETFIPLMQQNAAAWESAVAAGETLFNEAAFDAGRALYEGTLLGRPFRAVAKTFQVAVWRGLQQHWRDLEEVDRLLLEREWLPGAAAAFGEPAGLDT